MPVKKSATKVLAPSSVKKMRILEGVVVSDKMAKTIVVEVIRMFKHPLLGKIIKRSKKYKAHDQDKMARMGDVVEIAETRPLSKTKHMALRRVVRSAAQ